MMFDPIVEVVDEPLSVSRETVLRLKSLLCCVWACGSSRPCAMTFNIGFKADGFAAS
jgi:hypothetical protein